MEDKRIKEGEELRSIEDNIIKVVIVGEPCVGKTSMLVSFVQNRFPTEHVPTVFEDYASK